MILAEHIDADGAIVGSHLELRDGALCFLDDAGVSAKLSADVVLAVVRRYGKPLDDAVDPPDAEDDRALDLGAGRTLVPLRWRAAVDADARDYVVLHAPGEEPLCAMATPVAAALRALARAAIDRRSPTRS